MRALSKLDFYPYWLLLPAVIVAILVAIAPLIYGFVLSLHDWYLLRSPVPTWAGLANYRELLTDEDFWLAFARTWFWTLGTVVVEFAIGIPLALLLNRDTAVAKAVSAFILMPWVTPFIVVAYGWRFLLDSELGLLHGLLETASLAGDRSILADPLGALVMVTFISGWKGVPFVVIAMLAALKSIPAELYEAAEIDGAGRRQRFRFVTLPALRNTAVVIGLILGILAFYSFDLVWIMTRGGPVDSTTIVGISIYQTFFADLRPSYAATISSVMLAVLLVAALLTLRLRRAEA